MQIITLSPPGPLFGNKFYCPSTCFEPALNPQNKTHTHTHFGYTKI